MTAVTAGFVVYDLTGSIDIWPDAIGVVHLYGSYANGKTHYVKLVPSFGFPLTFNVKYS